MFDAIRNRISPYVEDIALAIEHIGSTSVPGLCAKPVIDIDIVVTASDRDAAIARLATAGYRHVGDLGVAERDAFAHAFEPPHNLYVCLSASVSLRNHLVLRQALRADAALAQTYGSLKRVLAERHPNDVDAYVAGKSELILAILRSSKEFAEGELDEIQRANDLG